MELARMACVAVCQIGRVLPAHLPNAPTIVLKKALALKERVFAILVTPATIVQVLHACTIAVEMVDAKMAFASASLRTLAIMH